MIRWNGFEIDRKNLTIRRDDRIIRFNRRNGRSHKFDLLCHMMLGGPQTYVELFDRLYSDDPDGGPLDLHVTCIHAHQLRAKLNILGVAVHYSSGYPRRVAVVMKNDS
jgi:hypothetical protein